MSKEADRQEQSIRNIQGRVPIEYNNLLDNSDLLNMPSFLNMMLYELGNMPWIFKAYFFLLLFLFTCLNSLGFIALGIGLLTHEYQIYSLWQVTHEDDENYWTFFKRERINLVALCLSSCMRGG